jgi:hypothetical protein
LGASFDSLDDIIAVLEHQDNLRGLGGAATVKPLPKKTSKEVINVGTVAVVHDKDTTDPVCVNAF